MPPEGDNPSSATGPPSHPRSRGGSAYNMENFLDESQTFGDPEYDVLEVTLPLTVTEMDEHPVVAASIE